MRLVLIHGASGNGATWEPVLPHFAWAEVAAADLPGRGETPGPAHDVVEATAAWLAGCLEATGKAPVVLLGHSYGGAVALQVALDRPDLVEGLVLVSSAARLRVHPAILDAVRASTMASPYRLDAAFGPGTPAAVIDGYAERSARTPPVSALADWRACDGFDVRARLGEVAVPTLVVHGSEDVLTPPRFQAMLEEALPHATRVVVEGRGHMLPWEDPAAVAAAVRAWGEVL
jgi:pimeloyl-ACP methyl ester carboxylesterase